MPRRNRPRRDEPREPRRRSTTAPIPAPPGWTAERYRGGEPDKDYTCPRCLRTVNRASDHVVAWLTGEDDERHRHWHSACWMSAVKEGIERYRFS